MTTPTYSYYDPNSSSYTIDPNSPGGWAQLPRNPNYVWGYMTGTVDTTQLNSLVPPGDQQRTMEKMVDLHGATVSAPATVTAPKYPHQITAPDVGGYYNSADSANSSGI
jgi:hypothetical protein